MSNAVVYTIWFEDSGMFYIGSTKNFKKRVQTHFRILRKNTHYNILLQSAWNNNRGNININSIHLSTIEEAYLLEQKMIENASKSPRKDLMTNISVNYNCLSRHPNKDQLIASRTEFLRSYQSSLSVSERATVYGRSGPLNYMFGKTHTKEVKELLSKLHKGYSFNKGCKLSKQHIEQIRNRQRLRTGKLNSFYNRHHSEKTKALIRERNKGKIPPNIRSVKVDDLVFKSCADTARHFNISQGLVTYRIKSLKYANWSYLDVVSNT